jgi:PAS domain S-box-containing protein
VLPGGDRVLIEADWNDGRMPSNAGVHTLDDYGPEAMAELLAGRNVLISDVSKDPRTSQPSVLAVYQSRNIRSYLDLPFMRDGRLTSVLFLHDTMPRAWTEQEVAYAHDVAERTWSAVERARAETALRRSEDEFRTLSDNLPTLCWMADPDGTIYWFNRRCCEFSGRSQQELVAGAWQDLHDPDRFPEVMERWSVSVATGVPFEMVFPLRRFDGAMHQFLTRVVPLRSADGTITKWFGTNVDITEQRAIEERLRASETKLRLLNETLEQKVAERTADRDRMWRLSTDIMLVARFDGTITAANPAWTSLLGWGEEELIGKTFLDFVHPDDLAATLDAVHGLASGETVLRFENRYQTRNEAYLWLSWTAVPDEQFIHAVGRNVTAEKEAAAQLDAAQERLRQAQKMEALGQLAGGIAHDFNNVLQAMSGGLNGIRRRASDSNAVLELVDMAEGAAKRGAAVTSRLLAFARNDELVAAAVPTAELLEGVREILVHTLNKSIKILTVWDPATPPLLADRAQLETVLVNLAVNARDAMPEGGQLTISGASDTVSERNPQGLAPGQYVRLGVTDTGSGMDAATLERACEPFFTTKPLGQGTGLGLAMARGFAQQSGGGFAISSILGQGTTVMLWFPQALAITKAGVAEPWETAGQAAHKRTRVLLAEDEPMVRGALAAHLEDAGFIVIPATDGLDALSRLDAGAAPDLLISDYAMPEMNGLVLVQEARRRMPDLPVLLITGYADSTLQSQLASVPGGGAVLLRKPVSAADLTTRALLLLESAAAPIG